MLLLGLVGATPGLGYLAGGLSNRCLASLAALRLGPPRLALGRSLKHDGFLRLPGRFDRELVAELQDQFRAAIAQPDGTKDFVRSAGGDSHVARRALTAPRRQLPSLRHLLDPVLEAELADYFRSDFYVSMVEAYRTFGLPEEARCAFGKFMTWHLDTQQHTDVVKLFIPLDAVAADQGPTEVFDKTRSLALSRRFARRLDHVHDAEIEREIAQAGGSSTMTAEPGDAYLIETLHCFHRAGVPGPGRTRDLLVIRLRPWSRLLAPAALGKGRVGRLTRRG